MNGQFCINKNKTISAILVANDIGLELTKAN